MIAKRINGASSSAVPIAMMVAMTLVVVTGSLWAASYMPSRSAAGGEAVAPVVDPVRLHEAWARTVGERLDRLGERPSAEDARQAKEALLALRVTAADKDAHLALVLALVSVEAGRGDGYVLLTAARKTVGK